MSQDVIQAKKDMINNSNQSEFLTILLEECLQEANLSYQDLDLIAFTNGPASFTSVRIGYVAAKMLQLCCDIDVFAVSSNLAIAFDYLDCKQSKIVTAIDARLGDAFFQIFNINNNIIESEGEILMVKIDEIEQYLPKDDDFLLVGSAKELIKEKLKNRKFNISQREDIIKSENIAKIAVKSYKKNQIISKEPIYIRNVIAF